jgi:hypothetical protein
MKKYISIILITLAVAGSSCKKTYLSELAVNPNTPAAATPGLLLTGALKKTADLTAPAAAPGGYAPYGFWMNYLAWSTGTQPNAAILLYQLTTSSFDYFTTIYGNIANYNAVIASTNEPYFVAIAKVMEVYDYQMLVDNYNNVPYSQALKGLTGLTPAYDKGSAIYDDLMVQLDAAIKLIQTAPVATSTAPGAAFPGSADIVYGATTVAKMNNWILFANTLKLRLAVRQSNLASKAAALKTAIQATASLGYISSAANEANVQPGYLNINGQQSPLDQTLGFTQTGGTSGNGSTYYANGYFTNSLIGGGTNLNPDDPRLFQIYAPSTTAIAGGKIIGTLLGQTATPTEIDPATGKATGVLQSKLSAFLLVPTKSTPIFSAAESLLLQAEAAKINPISGAALITGTPAALYKAGVEASFIDLGLTVAQADAYLALPAYAYPTSGTDAAQEQAIIYQKWVSLNPYGYLEAYNEYRRTGYPNVPLSIQTGITATNIPTRIPYPLSEYNTNASNVGAEGNFDVFSSKIFWAK